MFFGLVETSRTGLVRLLGWPGPRSSDAIGASNGSSQRDGFSEWTGQGMPEPGSAVLACFGGGEGTPLYILETATPFGGLLIL